MMTKEEREKAHLTNFGKFLRKLRIDNNLSMKNMAESLGVSASYISAVEMGKRKIPKDWNRKIVELFNLNENEQATLGDIIRDSRDELGKLEAAYNDAYAECFKAKTERDQYKSRCEALELVIKSGETCNYCNGDGERCEACGVLEGYEFFELDEAMFSGGDKE